MHPIYNMLRTEGGIVVSELKYIILYNFEQNGSLEWYSIRFLKNPYK